VGTTHYRLYPSRIYNVKNHSLFVQIKFSGEECGGVNFAYFMGLASLYSMVALVSLVQLLVAMAMSANLSLKHGSSHKTNCLKAAFEPTTPKVPLVLNPNISLELRHWRWIKF